MLYPGVAAITDDLLDEVTAKVEGFSDEDLLADFPHLAKMVQERHQAETERITEYYGGLLEQASELYDSDNRREYLDAHESLADVLHPLFKSKDQSHNTYDEACRLISQARGDAIARI